MLSVCQYFRVFFPNEAGNRLPIFVHCHQDFIHLFFESRGLSLDLINDYFLPEEAARRMSSILAEI